MLCIKHDRNQWWGPYPNSRLKNLKIFAKTREVWTCDRNGNPIEHLRTYTKGEKTLGMNDKGHIELALESMTRANQLINEMPSVSGCPSRHDAVDQIVKLVNQVYEHLTSAKMQTKEAYEVFGKYNEMLAKVNGLHSQFEKDCVKS
jgi:hypothetical protein